MNDTINNRIDSFRGRLAVLDQPEHLQVWQGKAPLVFSAKVTRIRSLMEALLETARVQSANLGGTTADKRREEVELENTAHLLGRALVAFSRDHHDESTAAKYDVPISSWRRLRDENLLQKSRLLEQDLQKLVEGPQSDTAVGYGLTLEALAQLQDHASEYESFMVAPVTVISQRGALTRELEPRTREIAALFDQLDDLAPQFKGAPGGAAFVERWLASGHVIARGKSGKSNVPQDAPASA